MHHFNPSARAGRLGIRILASLALVAGASMASAHHGWSWADGEQTTLVGIIESISMAPPHPTLKVKSREGQSWQVDLGNPTQTERSGFAAGTAKAGDPITVLGNRHKDASVMQLKAVRVTLDGKNYDKYPERIRK